MRQRGTMKRGPVTLLLLLLLCCLLAISTPAGVVALTARDTALCGAEGECVVHAATTDAPRHPGLVDTAVTPGAASGLHDTLAELLRWVAAPGSPESTNELARWLDQDVVIEAARTPAVPWRGRFEGLREASAFFALLRRGLFPTRDANRAGDNNLATGLQWSSATREEDQLLVRWEPSEMVEESSETNGDSATVRRSACGCWLHALSWPDVNGTIKILGASTKLRRLVVEHTRPLQCAAAFRTRAQQAFTDAFAHFFKMDYAGFRKSFDPDVNITWHGDAPVGKVFRGNAEGLDNFIRTRVQIFIQTRVEFEPLAADDASASYHVIFRPLTLRATGEVFGEVRGLVVVHINEAGLIYNYQMTLFDHYASSVLARALSE